MHHSNLQGYVPRCLSWKTLEEARKVRKVRKVRESRESIEIIAATNP